ncbi:signal recognition particle 54 kDa protein, putative [Eimeria tenella]|uniref:signal-recognition-particle GTPase n=1 Tax=Eimeria tenella TaxID=5802 RepID=U6KNS9_EIMTE|nr:signal recognition particle 54 kDa protein, putative [Eimeria tenella]CDJ37917.1 signal recognition particle 54 kDa protein, putative [Eimeria tenella]|eukprot:XP_013228755.1 signal recognition particle 54 kDa protein, putative [Eimeria tenella]
MVLAELGQQISGALRSLQSATIVDEAVVTECVKTVCRALLLADVQLRVVQDFRRRVTQQINSQIQQQSSSSSSSSSSRKKTAAAAAPKAVDAASGTVGPAGPQGDVMAEVYIQAAAAGVNTRRIIQKCVVAELAALVTPSKSPRALKRGSTNVVMFVGLQGAGKTTTCTKFALHYQRKGYRTALVCADTFRAGAFDQLKQSATKARIPFFGSYTEADPVKIAVEGVQQFRDEKYDLVIVDTSGRHRQEAALFEEMQQVAEAVAPDDIVLVVDSHIGQACFEQAAAFAASVSVGSVIITKLDGHAKGGGALSAVAATGAPIIFLGSGEHFDDFEPFDPNSFVSRLLGLGDVGGLVSSLKEVISVEKQQQMIDRISKGKFTLQDMYEQVQNVLKMGPISKVMSMIPGLGSNLIPKGQERLAAQRLKRLTCAMDSMTKEELACEKQFTDSRILRVAKGSGTSVAEVRLLLEQHKQFSKMVAKMGRAGLTKESSLQSLARNPSQLLQKMQTAVDPRLLKQIGGPGNIVNILKEFQSGEMGDMQEMMKQLGGLGAR